MCKCNAGCIKFCCRGIDYGRAEAVEWFVWGRRFEEEATTNLLPIDCRKQISHLAHQCHSLWRIYKLESPSPRIQCRIEWDVLVPNPQRQISWKSQESLFQCAFCTSCLRERVLSVSHSINQVAPIFNPILWMCGVWKCI